MNAIFYQQRIEIIYLCIINIKILMYFNLIQIIFYIDDICLLISMIFISVLLSVQVIARCLQASMVSERLVIGQ